MKSPPHMTPFSLAQTFADLANDPNWPPDKERVKLGMKYPELRDIYCGKLTMARLALMVVEKEADRLYFKADRGWLSDLEQWIVEAVNELEINPSHYANVKKRVEEADTEEK